nr:peroxisomal fatty acid beta-oxidation multifunctional protein AIM1-like [Tanacetum cinerariifolium]
TNAFPDRTFRSPIVDLLIKSGRNGKNNGKGYYLYEKGIVNEASRVTEEGVVVRASDLDVAYVLGMSFPSYRGGIVFWGDLVGAKHIYESLKKWNTNNPTNNSGNIEKEEEESSHFEIKKRKTTSKVWDEFKKIKLHDGRQKAECHHCKSTLSVLASGSTTHLGRHLKGCTQRAIFQKQQQRITLQVVDPDSLSQVVTPALVDGRFDMMKMRESMAH